ncbi:MULTISPECIES: hypothetical protein [Clostridium]|uniref:hypothetical protein n=1 Tax=Clostridium TaxID=1485 RepID=UPI00082514B3|nr:MULTISPECIES: hypothetical protein [Clostridium]PJI07275.1 hypothetical protein CUB90_05085 [Clostridium sp. CT7]
MRKPKIFTATFEESLNFEDDPILKRQNKDVEKPNKKERPVLFFIIACICILMLYGVHRLTVSLTIEQTADSSLPKADINFSPVWLFWLCFLIFVLFWIYTRFIRIKRNRIFWAHVNANNYLIWLALEFNLMFVTMLLKIFTAWGIIIIYCAFGLFAFLLFRRQIKSIQRTLFSSQDIRTRHNALKNKIINIALTLGGIACTCYLILKWRYPHIEDFGSGTDGLIQIVTMWVIFNLALIAIEIYIEFPYQVQGYYKRKYAEEYRKREGKSQIEWYGKRYFSKHILGTNKEDKAGNSQR